MLSRSHNQSCSKLLESAQALKFEPVVDSLTSASTKTAAAAASAAAAAAADNRSTFKCPFCGLKNLDSNNLVKHCNDKHQDSSTQVVRSQFVKLGRFMSISESIYVLIYIVSIHLYIYLSSYLKIVSY